MKQLKRVFVRVGIVFIALIVGVVGTTESIDVVEEAKEKTRIADIQRVPSMPFYDSGDFAYWEVVRRGLSAVPDLLLLVEDTSPTGISASHYGGEYRIGDIAFLALQDIVHGLPHLATPEGPRSFGEYLTLVRSNPDNRRVLRSRMEEWFFSVRTDLRWVSATAHPAGGWFELPNSLG